MSVTFNEATRAILDGRNFATVATLDPDGAPQTSVIWILRDGDEVLFSTTTRRRKARNLAADPRVSLSVFDLANPYTAVDIRGRVEIAEDPDKKVQEEITHKYTGQAPPAESDDVVRLVVRVIPERVIGFNV